MTNENDQIARMHERFDTLDESFRTVQAEQHVIAKKVDKVDHRVDLLEVQIEAAQKRERLVVESITDKLSTNSNLIKDLTAAFRNHTKDESDDRKKILFWLTTTVLSVGASAGFLLFNKVFGA
jgi:chromosome segregation ATPase